MPGTLIGMTQTSLGAMIRAWRQRVNPADVGLPGGRGERRTPGLRREELAWLAGVSPDYVKRVEQGRAHPSSDVVRALARALRVTREEYDLLARLAGHASSTGARVPQHITPGVQRMADRLGDVPLAIYDVTWTLLTANPPWSGLFGDPDAAQGRARNLVWLHFTGAVSGVRHTDLDRHESSLVADLRDAAVRYPKDPELAAMVDALLRISDRFAGFWALPTVARHGGQRKTITSRVVGEITLDCDVLTVHDADLRILMFTAAPHTPDADKLDVLNVVGLQDLTATEADQGIDPRGDVLGPARRHTERKPRR